MPILDFEGQCYVCDDNETVLDALVRQGATLHYSCRSGVCQSCMLQATSGEPGQDSQRSLNPNLRVQGYFLPCVCIPRENLKLRRPFSEQTLLSAVVESREYLTPEIARIRLRPESPFGYRPGQFINIFQGENGRSYSLASLPHEESIELHVRRVPGGLLSEWLHEVEPGDTCKISEPRGECFYCPGEPERPLLLIGTGTGLAPLYGVVRDALQTGHTGPIQLYHGSGTTNGLYLIDEFRALEAEYPNFRYVPCLSRETAKGFASGRAHDVALSERGNLSEWRVFLCGNADMVKIAKKQAFLAGASMSAIHADPFIPATGQPAKETAPA